MSWTFLLVWFSRDKYFPKPSSSIPSTSDVTAWEVEVIINFSKRNFESKLILYGVLRFTLGQMRGIVSSILFIWQVVCIFKRFLPSAFEWQLLMADELMFGLGSWLIIYERAKNLIQKSLNELMFSRVHQNPSPLISSFPHAILRSSG